MPSSRFPSALAASLSDPEALLRVSNLVFDASLEPSTQATYATHQRSYSRFCTAYNITAWPATRLSLQLFALDWVIGGRAHQSLPGIFSALKRKHIQHAWPWLSLSEQQWFATYMQGIKKLFPHQVRRKQPMTLHILHQLAAVADFSSLQQVQYITMAFLAHDGLLRASELIHLRLSDIRWFSDCVRIRIRNSKANKLSGLPEFIFIFPSHAIINGFSALKAYWQRANLNNATNPHAPLFPSEDGKTPVSKTTWVNYIRSLLTSIGFDPSQYSGHSFRSGGATDLWTAGARPRTIQKHGRWLSDAFWLYVRDNPEAPGREVAQAFSRLVSEIMHQ